MPVKAFTTSWTSADRHKYGDPRLISIVPLAFSPHEGRLPSTIVMVEQGRLCPYVARSLDILPRILGPPSQMLAVFGISSDPKGLIILLIVIEPIPKRFVKYVETSCGRTARVGPAYRK
ncbi:hypothetical protein FRB93_006502 [Tulasnella sp. JGI-2019a]|nr:hypothetical protein FRB93_006502 [Tulasnella sp. JGI-2019a]